MEVKQIRVQPGRAGQLIAGETQYLGPYLYCSIKWHFFPRVSMSERWLASLAVMKKSREVAICDSEQLEKATMSHWLRLSHPAPSVKTPQYLTSQVTTDRQTHTPDRRMQIPSFHGQVRHPSPLRRPSSTFDSASLVLSALV